MKPKTTWLPCAECGDPDGTKSTRSVNPTRVNGQPFGIDGQICFRCYQRHRSRRVHATYRASCVCQCSSCGCACHLVAAGR